MYAGAPKPEVYWSDEEDEDDEENKAKAAKRAADEEGLTRRQRRAQAVGGGLFIGLDYDADLAIEIDGARIETAGGPPRGGRVV